MHRVDLCKKKSELCCEGPLNALNMFQKLPKKAPKCARYNFPSSFRISLSSEEFEKRSPLAFDWK